MMWPTGQPNKQTMTKSPSQLKPVAGSELPLRISFWVMQKRLSVNGPSKRARMTPPLTGGDGKPTKTGLSHTEAWKLADRMADERLVRSKAGLIMDSDSRLIGGNFHRRILTFSLRQAR